MDNPAIFDFLNATLSDGKAAVLVTVISVTGSSMRNPGAHMAVSEDGQYVGSLSGGCIERSVVSEALDSLKDKRPRVVRFGEGSPYLDIRLPCGGGLDVHFMPFNDTKLAQHCKNAIVARKPFSISLLITQKDTHLSGEAKKLGLTILDDSISVSHEPNPKVLLIGHGAAMTSMARLSRQIQFDVEALTSDQSLMISLSDERFNVHLLKTPDQVTDIDSDPWTAIVFLFHDHDWEGALMAHALSQPHFYFGAMGGRIAHDARQKELQSRGVDAEVIRSIRAPIGLFHSSRDPDSLALSTLAEITKAFHQR
ncbi:MAG: XdhC family protein [Parasphingorhabdus sp.]